VETRVSTAPGAVDGDVGALVEVNENGIVLVELGGEVQVNCFTTISFI